MPICFRKTTPTWPGIPHRQVTESMAPTHPLQFLHFYSAPHFDFVSILTLHFPTRSHFLFHISFLHFNSAMFISVWILHFRNLRAGNLLPRIALMTVHFFCISTQAYNAISITIQTYNDHPHTKPNPSPKPFSFLRARDRHFSSYNNRLSKCPKAPLVRSKKLPESLFNMLLIFHQKIFQVVIEALNPRVTPQSRYQSTNS